MRTNPRIARIRVGIVIGVASLVTVGAVWASAPLDQYKQFGKSDPEIWDVHTGLHWQRTVPAVVTNHAGALSACSALGGSWRLPTVKELQTIVDEETYSVFEGGSVVTRALDRNAFPYAPTGAYWTLTPVKDQPGLMWLVDFSTGAARVQTTSPQEMAYTRCVHP